MIKRYIGDLEIRLQYVGRTADNRANYLGTIILPDGSRHNFADLHSGVGCPGTRDEDFDSIAEAAVDFAAYYTTHNRGDEVPDWAPPAELADAIAEAAMPGMAENEGYIVHRDQPRPYAVTFAFEGGIQVDACSKEEAKAAVENMDADELHELVRASFTVKSVEEA